MERIGLRDEDMEAVKGNGEMDEREKSLLLGAKKMKSLDEVLGEVEVLIDTRFLNQFSEMKSTVFLKKVIANQNVVDLGLLKTWRSLNCSPKTLKVIR